MHITLRYRRFVQLFLLTVTALGIGAGCTAASLQQGGWSGSERASLFGLASSPPTPVIESTYSSAAMQANGDTYSAVPQSGPIPMADPVCGDYYCDLLLEEGICLTDCCGNGICSGPVEYIATCPVDCPPLSGNAAPYNVALTQPVNDSTITGLYEFRARALDVEDPVGTLVVEIQMDGTAICTASWDSGLERYTCNWDCSPYGISTPETHSFTVRATDSAAASTASAAVTVNIFNPPPNYPPEIIAINSPTSGATVSGIVTLTTTVDDEEDGPLGRNMTVLFLVGPATKGESPCVGVRVNAGVTPQIYQCWWDTTGSWGLTAPEAATIDVRVTDSDGFITRTTDYTPVKTVAITVDNTAPLIPPTAYLISPTAGETIRGMYMLQAQVTDDATVMPSGVVFRLDGAVVTCTGGMIYNSVTNLYECLWDSSALGTAAPETHYFEVQVTDVDGLTDTDGPRSVTIDNVPPPPPNTPPSISFIRPLATSTVSGTAYPIQISATDAEDAAGTLVVQILIDDTYTCAPFVNQPLGSTTYECLWDSTDMGAPGIYNGVLFTARVTDSGGLTAEATVTPTVFVAAPPPTTGLPLSVADTSVNIGGAQPVLSISGLLPDSCTSIREANQSRTGNTIVIEVLTRRNSTLMCAQVIRVVYLNIPLGGGFPSGEYQVSVNGVELSFTIP